MKNQLLVLLLLVGVGSGSTLRGSTVTEKVRARTSAMEVFCGSAVGAACLRLWSIAGNATGDADVMGKLFNHHPILSCGLYLGGAVAGVLGFHRYRQNSAPEIPVKSK